MRPFAVLGCLCACSSGAPNGLVADAATVDTPSLADGPVLGDAPSPSDAPPPGGDAGTISCGGETCVAYPEPLDTDPHPFCCVDPLANPSPPTCQTMLGQCQTGIPFFCDETADCSPGLICCVSTVRLLFACSSSCDDIRLCRLSKECPGAMPCVPYICGGKSLATCGPLSDSQRMMLGCQ